MRKLRPVVVFCLFFSFATCEAAPDFVVIALATGTSGNTDIRLAQEVVDGEPGIPIRFVNDPEAEENDAATEVARAARFLEIENLIGVVGHPGSRASLVAAPLYNEAGILQVVPFGTSRRLQDAGRWTFTLAPNDSVEGAAIGRFVAEDLEAESATVFFVTDEYGYGLRDGVVANLEARGVGVLDQVPVRTMYQLADAEEADLSSLVEAALDRGQPDVVILAARDFTAQIVVPLVLSRYPDVRFVAGDGVIMGRAAREDLGPYLHRLHLTLFWHHELGSPESRDFAERYRRVGGENPSHDHALNYDGLLLLATAVRQAGPDPEKMREWLLSLGRERAPFQGVTGLISFTPERDFPVFLVRADSLLGS